MILKTFLPQPPTFYRTWPLYITLVQKHASRVYFHAGQVLSLSLTGFFGFVLWIRASELEFMNLWIYLFLEVTVNFRLKAFTLNGRLHTKGLEKTRFSLWEVLFWLHTMTNSGQMSHLHRFSGLYLMSLMHRKEFLSHPNPGHVTR